MHMSADWTEPPDHITEHLTVHEALWLPSWRVYHTPSEEEQDAIASLADKIELVRAQFDAGINVHCWMRPQHANCPDHPRHDQDYNDFIGSTSNTSGHISGKAVDFHISGYAGADGCARARQQILPLLDELELRMEDIQGAWIHLDTKPAASQRFFKP